MAAHRYWRLLFTSAVNGGNYYGVSEVTMAAVAGGPNQCVGGTAAAASTYPGYPPSQAFDGNASSFWTNNGAVPEWLSYDFGAGNAKDIVEFSFTPRSDGTTPQTPKTGSLQYSDDNATWTSTIAFSGSASPVTGQVQSFPPPTLTGVYFDLTNKSANIGLNPMQVKATSSGNGSVAMTRSLSGPSYVEFTITTLTGTPVIGLVNGSYNMGTSSLLGLDANSVGYRSGGVVMANAVTLATLGAFVQGDRVDMAVSPGNRWVWFRVNGGNWNGNAANDPATGVGGIDISGVTFNKTIVAVGASVTGTVITGNMLISSFVGAVPAGFQGIEVIQTVRADPSPNNMANPPGAPATGFVARLSDILLGKSTRNVFWPAGPITGVSGILKEAGVVKPGKKIRVYDSVDGTLLGDTISAADGSFSLPAVGRPKVFVVAFDPPFNALVYDAVIPG